MHNRISVLKCAARSLHSSVSGSDSKWAQGRSRNHSCAQALHVTTHLPHILPSNLPKHHVEKSWQVSALTPFL